MTSPQEQLEWTEYFARVQAVLRLRFHSRFPFTDDGEVSPDLVAMRDGFYAFPSKVEILEIDTNGFKSEYNDERVWTLVRHELVQSSQPLVTYHGRALLADLARHEPLIRDTFGQDGLTTPESLKDLRPFNC